MRVHEILCQKHSQSESQKEQTVKQIIKMSSRYKPQGLRVLIMQCIFIKSFYFYFDAVFRERPRSVPLKFFGLILASLAQSSYHFIRWLSEAFSNAVLQKHFPFLMKLECCRNFCVMAQELCYPWSDFYFQGKGVVTNDSCNVNRVYSK